MQRLAISLDPAGFEGGRRWRVARQAVRGDDEGERKLVDRGLSQYGSVSVLTPAFSASCRTDTCAASR